MHLVETERERVSDDGAPPIAWERYLEIAPSLSTMDAAARIEKLGTLGIEQDVWSRAEAYWLLTFALEAKRGVREHVDAFGKACAVALEGAGSDLASAVNEAPLAQAPPVSATETARDSGARNETANVAPLSPPPVEPSIPTFLKAAPAPVSLQIASVPTAPAPLRSLASATLDGPLPPHGPAVPFGSRLAPDYAARLATPAAPSRRKAADPFGGTMEALSPSTGPATPFERAPAGAAGPSRPPELTVVQHAMLSAELAADTKGTRRGEILARYGISGAAVLAQLAAEWQSRIRSDPRLSSQWHDAYARHCAALQGQRR